MDRIEIDLTLTCGHVQLGPQIIYNIYTSINNSYEIMEAIAAKRMGW